MDKCYNECAKMLIRELKEDLGRKAQMIGILFGTHNWMSCELILKELVTMGLAKHVEGEGEEVMSLGDEVTERLTIGQLFGECCIFPWSDGSGLTFSSFQV